jgi:sugar transferase EpsL
MNRYFDVFLSSIVIVLLGPVMLLVAVAIRLRLGSPVLFWQVRAGRGGVPFSLVKFRTMRIVDDEAAVGIADAERLDAFGRIVRRSSFDELPQLFNVIRGDMALVGPRPLFLEYTALYSARQRSRLLVRPGITGLAQVTGRNGLSWNDKLELDAQYVERRSIVLDLSILFRTLGVVIVGTGVTQRGHATSERFTGSK